MTDADEDTAQTTVTVEIAKPDAPSFTGTVTVDEKGLNDAQDASETVNWTPPAGYTVVGATDGALGTVTIQDGQVEYTLSGAIGHDPVQGTNTAANADHFTVTIRDAQGNTYNVTVNVDVIDDIPTISTEDTKLQVSSGSEVTGSVDIDYGADGGKSLTVNGQDGQPTSDGKLSFGLENGTLVFDPATGDYTFTANANVTGSQKLTFEVTDADEDTAQTTVTVGIAKPDAPSFTEKVTVDEKGLNDEQDASETVNWTPPSGYTVVGVKDGDRGTVTIKEGQVEYTLSGAITHAPGQDDNTAENADHFTVTIRDAKGNTYDVTVNVDVIDDVPRLTMPGAHQEHAVDVAVGSITDTFTVDFGADGPAGKPAFTFDGHDLVEAPGGGWQYTSADGYTVTVVQTGTNGNEFQYSYTLEYDSTKVKEGFGGELKVVATDSDQDTEVGTIHIAVTNTPPVATDDVYDIDKAVTGESIISASASAVLGTSIITVGGRVDRDIDAKWMEGKEDGAFSVLERNTGDDLFGKFFSDLGGNNLTLDTLKDAAHIYTLEITSNTTGEQIQAAVKYASEHNLLLYIDGDLSSSLLGNTPLNCVTIVNGDFSVDNAGFGANSFLYVTGNMHAEADFTVSGGLAVDGSLTGSASIEVEHTADVFTPDNVVISTAVSPGDMPSTSVTITFDDLLRNDMDSDDASVSKDGLHITEITIGGKTYTADTPHSDIDYNGTTKVSIDWEKGTVSVTNTGKNSESIQFGYEVSDRHGATDTASITVNVTATRDAGSIGDDLLQGATTTENHTESYNICFALDNSGSMKNSYTTAKNAVADYITKLWNDIQETDAAINLSIIKFNSSASISRTFTLTSTTTKAQLDKYISDYVTNGSTNGYTNYEDALEKAEKWFNSVEENGFANRLYFISDGEPNRSNSGGKDHAGNAETVYNRIVDDKPHPVDVHAIGILGNGATNLDVLDRFDNTPIEGASHNATTIKNASELYEAIESSTVNKPISDTIFANKGDDVVFGDTAQFIVDGHTVSLADYVKAQLGFNPSTADVIDYVRDHPQEIGDALVPNTSEGKPDMPDALIGGEGNDVIYGQGGNDLLIGDGSNVSGADDTLHQLAQELHDLTGQIHAITPGALSESILHLNHSDLHTLAEWSEQHMESSSDGKDWLFGGEGDDVIFGMGGNDMLYGGKGDDILFGGSGNDYLDGGEGADRIYGGSGNDIIRYDAHDILVDGGDGLDFLVGENVMDTLLGQNGAEKSGIEIHGIEFIVDTTDQSVLALTDMDSLADKLGITLHEDGTVDMGDAWTPQESVTINNVEYVEYHSTHEQDTAILVQKAVMENHNG